MWSGQSEGSLAFQTVRTLRRSKRESADSRKEVYANPALRKNLTVPQVLLGFGENAAPVLRWLDAADSLPSQV